MKYIFAPSNKGKLFVYKIDIALDITWLAYADINGEMDWFTANTWAEGLNINGFTGGLATVADRNSALWCRRQASIQRRPGAGGRP